MVECHGGQSFQVGNGRGGSYHHFRFPLIPGNQTSRRIFCFISCLKPEVVVNWHQANKHKPYLLTCLFPPLVQFLHLLELDIRRKRVSSSTKFGDCHFGHLPSHSMRRSVYDMAVGIWRQSTFDGKAFGKLTLGLRSVRI